MAPNWHYCKVVRVQPVWVYWTPWYVGRYRKLDTGRIVQAVQVSQAAYCFVADWYCVGPAVTCAFEVSLGSLALFVICYAISLPMLSAVVQGRFFSNVPLELQGRARAVLMLRFRCQLPWPHMPRDYEFRRRAPWRSPRRRDCWRASRRFSLEGNRARCDVMEGGSLRPSTPASDREGF